MKQDSFSFGEDPGEKVNPAYDWDWWDLWPEGLSYQAYMILQIRRDLRALKEALEEEDRVFFQHRIDMYRDAYNETKKEAAASQGPSPQHTTA